jgi:carbon storage regulator
MLSLTRKESQSITIGNATITITKIKGNRVQIGIEAPKEVRVLRGELVKREEAA